MRTTVTLNGSSSVSANYVSWSPIPATVSLADPTGATGPVPVILSNAQPTGPGGQVIFFGVLPGTGQDQLSLTLPLDGTPVPFFLAGKFGHPSADDKDASLQVADAAGSTVLSVTQLMVRVRKNANALTPAERDRFRAAMATLNDRGRGRFSDFRDMHTSVALGEAHGNAGFLPWHRAYLLDLERELQNIDPSVALPYWRFDEAAPNLFTEEFLGTADQNGTVQFAPDNPLQFWRTDQGDGIVRNPLFDTTTEPANQSGAPLLTQDATLALGTIYALFRAMEGDPHGSAHVSFGGYISDPATAPKDPLFFLLHANVDRLWGRWQLANNRYDLTSKDTYEYLGSAGSPGATRIGHNLNDTMWPWNLVTTRPRPHTAPGGHMTPSSLASAPGLSPIVRQMIDFQGLTDGASRLGFDYDDVPFQF